MDTKKIIRNSPPEDIKGFEEFIEGENREQTFLPRPPVSGTKKEVSFEHFTFLMNDSQRLARIKNLFSSKLPFAAKFEQAHKLLDDQNTEIRALKAKIFTIAEATESPYRKSLGELFDGFFAPPKKP